MTITKLFFGQLISLLVFTIGGSKINQKLFVDVDAINFADPQKHGFLIILNEYFVKNYLQESQFPTLFVTAIPLTNGGRNGNNHTNNIGAHTNGAQGGRISKILYPEVIQEGKLIKLDNLRERAWYYVCIEFENMNRHNETTGATCKLFRTMDKFGLPAISTLTDVRISAVSSASLAFKANVELDFPLKLTVYLTNYEGEAKVYILKRNTNLNITFNDLAPNTNYGPLCVLEEPLVTAYTVMGRLVHANLERCYFDSVRTSKSEEAQIVTAQPQIRLMERFDSEWTSRSPRSGCSRELFEKINFYSLFALIICLFWL